MGWSIQLSTSEQVSNIKTIVTNPINDNAIERLLKNYKTMPLGMDEDEDFRISIAGAQEKTGLLYMNGQWFRPKGATPTTHIIKLPIGKIENANGVIDLSCSVENEWLCLALMDALEIPVAKAAIKHFGEMTALSVERFDRGWADDASWIKRYMQEDMCQVFGVSGQLKYEGKGGPGIPDLMQILMGSSNPDYDRYMLMKALFVFWLLGGIDGHAKNISVRLLEGDRYKLTPFYDVISAYPLTKTHQLELKSMKMAIGVKSRNKHYKWDEIMPRHWVQQAKAVHFPEQEMAGIIDDVCKSLPAAIAKTQAVLPDGFPGDIADTIFEGIQHAARRCQ